MSTNSTKIKIRISLIILSLFLPLAYAISVSAGDSGLKAGQLREYSVNNIYFYKPCVNSNSFSSICGDTAREKYWSALIAAGFEDYQAAAIFGSIDHEGSFGPTLWQWQNIVDRSTKQFVPGVTWDTLFNCPQGSCPGGVGAFQITWELSWYLQQIDKESPDLIKYFKDPVNYQLSGDEMLEKIGATDFDKLVDQEIKHFVLDSRKASSDGLKATKTLEEATDYWTKTVENCKNCCGDADKDKSCEQIEPRRASAKKELEEMQGFTCGGSSGSTVANTSQFTLLEGYGQISFYGPSAEENGGRAGQNGTDSINNNMLADGQVAKDRRDGGLLQYGDVIYIETTSEPNANGSYANGKFFIVADEGADTIVDSEDNNGTWDIDVFVNTSNSKEENYPPYGTYKSPKIYKVASGVTWEEYLEKYHDKTGASTGDPCSGGGSTGNAIADMALKLSWDCGDGPNCQPSNNPKPEYVEAMQAVGTYDDPGNWGYGASCDRFVATVMRYTKLDENFPTGYANDSGVYMLNHPELYDSFDFTGDFSVLKSGDILSTYSPPGRPHGHIWIYVEINGQPGRADASNGTDKGRTAEHYTSTSILNDSRSFKVFRKK